MGDEDIEFEDVEDDEVKEFNAAETKTHLVRIN